MNHLKKTLRTIISLFLGFLAFCMCYLLLAFWLPYVTVNPDWVKSEKGIEIFVESNGVHTDFVMPVKTEAINWFQKFPCCDFENVDTSYGYVATGWGDKGFFLDTKTWGDLKFSTAFNAVFGLGSTAMHVRYLKGRLKEDESTRRLVISQAQYKMLIEYILSSFKIENSRILHIKHPGYWPNDTFYESEGRYSLFKTCNVWTCNGLKQIGVKIGIWSPFDRGIIDHLGR